MPRWKSAAKNLTAFSRRWSLNSPAVEVLTGIIPVAQVDKHWTDDRIQVWGMFTQVGGTATGGRLGACTLVAQEKEVLVHKIEAWIDGGLAAIHTVHLFTPLQTYAPTELNAALVLPWLQPVDPDEPGRLARTIGVIGETDAGLMVVTVNGAPHTAIGPLYKLQHGAATVTQSAPVMWTYQDPPLRVRPFQTLAVQVVTTLNPAFLINVNWYFSERIAQGEVG